MHAARLGIDIGYAGLRSSATNKHHKYNESGDTKCSHHHGHGQGGLGAQDPDEWRGSGPDSELQHTQQRRRAPGGARVIGQRQGGGIRQDEAETGDDDEQRRQHPHKAGATGGDDCQQRRAACCSGDQSHGQQAQWRHPTDEPPVDLASDHQSAGVHSERDAEQLG